MNASSFIGLKNSVLGRKLLFSILLFSTIVTLFLTSFQIYIDYKKGIDGIYDRIDQIRLTQLESLAQNLWNINTDQIRIQLKGLLEIKSIKALEIQSPDNENISIRKEGKISDPIVTKLPLVYKSKNRQVDMGYLEIISDRSDVLNELQSKIFIILLTQAMKTFLVSTFIIFIYNVLVNKHITEIARFARSMSLENIGRHLKLDRGENEDQDELDDLAEAFNFMQDRIALEMEQRKEFEKQLRQSQKMEALGTLASGIAHDFNNILQGLYNALFLLEEEVIDNADALQRLETANGLTDRARELVRQILTFTRQEEGDFEAFSPIAPIQDVVEILRAAANNKVAIDLIIDPPDGKVVGDQTQLKQVILNLGNNAIQAVENVAHPKVVLRVTSASYKNQQGPDLPPGHYLKVEVLDNGEGIDKHTIERVFEPFFTTKDVGKGTGLGLSVVLGIIQRHHGAISIESEVGEGTTVTAHIPLHREIGKEVPSYKGNERILFYSNNSETAANYCHIFEYMHHSYVLVESEKELYSALKIEKKGSANIKIKTTVVYLDYRSLEDGETFLRSLRQICKDCPIVVIGNEEVKATIPEPLYIQEQNTIASLSGHENSDVSLLYASRAIRKSITGAYEKLSLS